MVERVLRVLGSHSYGQGGSHIVHWRPSGNGIYGWFVGLLGKGERAEWCAVSAAFRCYGGWWDCAGAIITAICCVSQVTVPFLAVWPTLGDVGKGQT